MSNKTVCIVIRISSLTAALILLQEMYGVGFIGYVAICLTALAWSIARYIEDRQ